MKISFIIPERGVHPFDKNWMWFVAKELEKKHTVMINSCTKDCDVILGMTIGMINMIRIAINQFPDIPYILYNWDMHPLLQPEVGKWDEIGWDKMLEGALDVWTQTEYHAKFSEEITGVKHFVMPICALDFEFEHVRPIKGDYALMASRRVDYKGFELFEEGCQEVGIRSVSRHPDFGGRDDYIEELSRCRCLVVASEEEANSPMSAYEGAFLGKVLLLSDIEANKEEWGDTAVYFKVKDKEDFKEKLKDIFQGNYDHKGQQSKELALSKFRVRDFVKRINDRLEDICE